MGQRKSRAVRRFGLQRGQTAGIALGRRGGLGVRAVVAATGICLDTFIRHRDSDISILALCGEALRRGCGEEILHVSGDPRR